MTDEEKDRLFSEALDELRELDELPMAQVDEIEQRSRAALSKLARVTDATQTIMSRGALAASSRSLIRTLNHGVDMATGLWVVATAGCVVCAATGKVDGTGPVVAFEVIALFLMILARWDRRRWLRTPFCPRKEQK